MPRSAHDVLGVPPNATPEQIRTAYKRRARELHPDVSKGREAEWAELQTAYTRLTNGEPPKSEFRGDQFVVNFIEKVEPALHEAVNVGASFVERQLSSVGKGWFGDLLQSVGKVATEELATKAKATISETLRHGKAN